MAEEQKIKYTVEGNPGTNNTFINIGHVENYNPNATTVNNTVNNNYYGTQGGGQSAKSAEEEKPEGKKLGEKTLREMLKDDLIDTGNIQKEIANYYSCITTFVKQDMSKVYLRLWGRILDHEAFKVDLYDPGKQQCHYNRNLVANIIHYLDGKGFYKEPYNASRMARALEGDDQHPIRRALGFDPDKQYRDAVDAILEEL